MTSPHDLSATPRSPDPAAALGLADLAALDAGEAARRNADLAYLARRVFRLGGVAVRFIADTAPNAEAAPTAAGAGAGGGPAATAGAAGLVEAADDVAVWLWLEWAGAPLLAGLSAAWAAALAQGAGVGLEQLSDETLDLLWQLRLSARLPAGLVLRQAAFRREALTDLPAGLAFTGRWTGLHQATGEASGHGVQLWAGPGFPLQALHRAFEPFVSEVLPSPLAQLPIALPLVAARWSVDAAELQDLAVGDVLLLG
jgi:hypothetical protein